MTGIDDIKNSKDSKDINSELHPHMVLRLGTRRYACDILSIQEIVSCPELEPPLAGADFLIGLFNSSRGDLPVLDLLSRPPDICPIKDMMLVIFEVSGQLISLLVDELLEIVEFNPQTILPLPEGANGVPDNLLSGVIEIQEKSHYMLDLDQIATAWLCTVSENRSMPGGNVSDQ